MSRTSRNFEILVVEFGWWFSSGLEESFSVSRTKLFWKKRRNDRWNILTEKDGMDIKEILTQRRNIRLLGNNRMSNPRYTSVENEMMACTAESRGWCTRFVSFDLIRQGVGSLSSSHCLPIG